jgi:cyanobactin biosynthesis protein (PatB/AcyB/McaB family)
MKLPKQVKPVVRPALIQPHTVLNFRNATGQDEGLNLVFNLENGANYNDPMRFSTPIEFCGCHLLSVTSSAICQALCLR